MRFIFQSPYLSQAPYLIVSITSTAMKLSYLPSLLLLLLPLLITASPVADPELQPRKQKQAKGGTAGSGNRQVQPQGGTTGTGNRQYQAQDSGSGGNTPVHAMDGPDNTNWNGFNMNSGGCSMLWPCSADDSDLTAAQDPTCKDCELRGPKYRRRPPITD